MVPIARLGLTTLLVAVGACAHRAGAAGGPSAPQAAQAPTRIEVTNHYGLPVEIYVAAGGAYERMGTVAPGIEGRFTVHRAMLGVGPIEFVAVPAGNEPPVRTGRLLLDPGDVVEFEIAATLVHSVTRVRH